MAWPDEQELPANAWQQLPREVTPESHPSYFGAAERAGAVLSPLPLASLLHSAKLLDRAARTVFEESGAHTLYMAAHLLEYRDKTTPETPRYAPLVLMPVRLVIDRLRGNVLLRWTGDDASLNITLFEKLKRDQGLDLKKLLSETDAEGEISQDLIAGVKELTTRMEGWELHPEAHLGLFSFSKFLMWSDLRDNQTALLENPVVRHIASNDAHDALPYESIPDAQALDRPPFSTSEIPLVLPADSSQVAAIRAALDGKNFVLQGPPGTGKSQTITNMIAALLAAGKTVLFVSEKMAALEVVDRRLRAIGLGDFCLELHSAESNKKAVVESLQISYERSSRVANSHFTRRAQNLDGLRDRLNELVEALHTPRPLGKTVHQAIERCLELDDAPIIRLNIAALNQLDETTYRQMQDALSEFALRAAEVEPVADHPWRGASPGPWQATMRPRIADMLTEVSSTLIEASSARQTLWNTLELKDDLREPAIDAAWQLAQALGAGDIPEGALTREWDHVLEAVGRWKQWQVELSDMRQSLASQWLPEIEDPALESLTHALADAVRLPSWLAPARAFGARWKLKQVARTRLPDNQSLLEALQTAERIRERVRQLDDLQSKLEASLQPAFGLPAAQDLGWQPGEDQATLAGLDAVCERGDRMRRACRALAGLGQHVDAEHLRRLALHSRDALTEAAWAWFQITETIERHDSRVRSALGWNDASRWPLPGDSGHMAAWGSLSATLAQHMGSLQSWCFYKMAATALEHLGLASVVEAHARRQCAAGNITVAFERSLLEAWLAAVRDETPCLLSFYGPEHTLVATRFRELDDELQALSRQHVVEKLEERLPTLQGAATVGGEPAVLMREATKKNRHMSVRSLLQRIPNLAFRLKPCFMMSPLSVAQYLPPGFKRFDVVIFDEASQIGTHDAIGAIARGDQVIIVGDSKQLPPTTFFQRRDDEDAVMDDDELIELESILEEAVVKQIPQHLLGWHYRSRHDALIAFSNAHYYEHRLTIFPPANRLSDHLGIKWHPVSEGCYENQSNVKEAEALVTHLLEALRTTSAAHASFGVVTFSVSQQVLILDMLDAAREREPGLEHHFQGNEPVFVKNLENVQGDERDVMYFSICYANDRDGKLRMQFGPLSILGGERRLNVAVTRARTRMHVFSSLRHEQIDLNRTQSVGAAHLRAFLQFAASQGQWAPGETSGEQAAGPLQRAISEVIEQAGYEVHTEIGAGAYRVALAVRHPDHADQYALGIETDGMHYASGATARDRDHVRLAVLKNLGWQLARVYALDWWHDPAGEAQRVLSQLQAALQAGHDEEETAHIKEVSAMPLSTESPRVERASAPTQPYQLCQLSHAPGGSSGLALAASSNQLAQQCLAIIAVEGPVHIDLICRRLMLAYGIKRISEKLRQIVRDALEQERHALHQEGPFFRLLSQAERPVEGIRSGQRDPEHWPTDEIAWALSWLLSSALSLSRDEAQRELARLFGLQRGGKQVETALERGLESLTRSGHCREKDGLLIWELQ